MKIFICADIEGTAGITHWDEGTKGHTDYVEFREYMTDEVVAACEGARAAGATEIVVRDAHAWGRNLILSKLPDYVRIMRSWSGHPDLMMFGLDATFAAALYTGFHSKAGTDTHPLAHTMSSRTVSRLLINGEVESEYTLSALCAARYGVPSAFLSGDAGMCAEAKVLVPAIGTVATSEGFGPATSSLSPKAAVAAIRDGVEAALSRDLSACLPKLADRFELVVEYTTPDKAYNVSWYPGVEHVAARTLRFKAADFFDILRAVRFII
ncbi:M55 family metallopeptidase [Mesorhizobium sp.]|uniref:M55 family metallopeptidase n=1 Tax=Mesorhizobium sp. TaxID=1871066 RepID=UPI000FE98A2F|nr:M55 family metallopeptidase [Mesorhizobium sp.]RWI99978.1 MAG: peptide ABC transporter [Mesorhizobium sp.]RWM04942.1 MAG: peptide ABC transporter [Mesorhizobium sp.]RWO82171.1 MAG: peptide ABC transporter [Mesorhizobium sp.]